MWFMEEVGELSAALRGGTHDERVLEFADVLAWLATLANIAGVDLDEAMRRKYGTGCPGCGQTPCPAPRPRSREAHRGALDAEPDLRSWLPARAAVVARSRRPGRRPSPPPRSRSTSVQVGLPPGRFVGERDAGDAARRQHRQARTPGPPSTST